MNPWSGWSLPRVLLGFALVLYLGIWVQVTLFHWAAAFRRRAMWGPVILTPLIVTIGIVALADREGWIGWIAAAAMAVGIIDGLIGLGFHLGGVMGQVGGLSMRNLMSGPPPVLPVAYSLFGALGLVGVLWGA